MDSTTTTTELLLVEDEPANRALMRAIVAKASAQGIARFELVEADDLHAARERLATARFRAILLDVRLPDGDGLELLPEVHALGPERPWIMVWSASVHLDDRVRALGAGADLFLGKPIDAALVIDTLRRVASEPPPWPTTLPATVEAGRP